MGKYHKNKNQVFVCIFISSFLIVHLSDSAKVIFAKNTTAAVIREREKVNYLNSQASAPVMATIINIPSGCKPGFVWESTFHNRCRKIVG